MKICGVISEIDINNVIRLRLTIVVGLIFIDGIVGNDFLSIKDSNNYQYFECCMIEEK